MEHLIAKRSCQIDFHCQASSGTLSATRSSKRPLHVNAADDNFTSSTINQRYHLSHLRAYDTTTTGMAELAPLTSVREGVDGEGSHI